MLRIISFVCSFSLFSFVLMLPPTSSSPDCTTRHFDDAVNCCHIPAPPKKIDDAFHECEIIGGANNTTSIEKSRFKCIDHCILNKAGMLTEQAELNINVMRDYFTATLEENPDWQDSYKQTIQTCMHDELHTHDIDGICKENTLISFFNCLLRQHFIHCPPRARQESKECSELRTCIMEHEQALPPSPSYTV